jgi:Nickel responsive protein SCO4226-like
MPGRAPGRSFRRVNRPEGIDMPKYVIERTLPGAGNLTAEELTAVAARSNGVLSDMGGDTQWLQSYVTGDKLYCVYIAPDAERVYEHARCGGFPADSVEQVTTVIDPTTAEATVPAA